MINFYNAADNLLYAKPNSQFITQDRFRGNVASNPGEIEEEKITETFGIPATEVYQNNNGGDNFNRSFSNNPYTANLNQGQFVTNRTSYGSTGYLPGTKPEPNKFQPAMDLIGKGIGMAIPGGNFLMGMAKQNSRENKLNAYDNAFIDMQLANQEQSVHGGGNLTNQDRYGYNKVSAFGNYSNVVADKVAIANEKIAAGKELTDIDNYYLEKEKEKEDITNQINFNNFVKQRMTANKIRAGIKKGIIDPGFNIHTDPPGGDGGGSGPKDGFGITAQGNYVNQFEGGDPGQGSGDTESQTDSQAGVGGFADYANGGRIGYFFGGLAARGMKR